MFLGDSKENKELKRKEFSKMKCRSYDRKDLSKHFKRITHLFYALGANINLKQAFLTSLPKVLAIGTEIYIQNKFGSILNLTAGQIRQATFLALEDICNKRSVIRDYMKGDACIDQACKRPELKIEGKCFSCKRKGKKTKKRFRKIRLTDQVYSRKK